MEIKRFEAKPGYAIGTLKFIEKLKDGKPGDQISDKELSDFAGEDTRHSDRAIRHLQSAIRYCINNHGVLWQRVRGENFLKCLEHKERVDKVGSRIRHIGRESYRARRESETVDMAQLDDKSKSQFLTTVAQFGAIQMMTTTKTMERIQNKSVNTVEQAKEIGKRLLEHLA